MCNWQSEIDKKKIYSKKGTPPSTKYPKQIIKANHVLKALFPR